MLLVTLSNRHSVYSLGMVSTDCRAPIVAGTSHDKRSVCTSTSGTCIVRIKGWRCWFYGVIESIVFSLVYPPTWYRNSYVRIWYVIPGTWYAHRIICSMHTTTRTCYGSCTRTRALQVRLTVRVRVRYSGRRVLRNVNLASRFEVSFTRPYQLHCLCFVFNFSGPKINRFHRLLCRSFACTAKNACHDRHKTESTSGRY